MQYNFDRVPERKGTNTFKWDSMEKLFGRNDLLPMWVADMDFPVPEGVRRSIENRARHGIFGYTFTPESAYQAVIDWMKHRHGWEIEREWLSLMPGVMPSVAFVIQAFTSPGDGVIVQPPVYYPFFSVVKANGREVLENPLQIDSDGKYLIDFAGLEEKLKQGGKILLLCTPHNPVGRVWTREELAETGRLCRKHGAIVLSDEIHADLVFPGVNHLPFPTVSGELRDISIVARAPSKSFNIPGLTISELIIPSERLRTRFSRYNRALFMHITNLFSTIALEAAYREGSEWLDHVLRYIEENIEFAGEWFGNNLPEVSFRKPEGTYLLWLDCRKTGLDAGESARRLKERGKIALNPGEMFGTGGEGFHRMNVACPRRLVEEGCRRIAAAFR